MPILRMNVRVGAAIIVFVVWRPDCHRRHCCRCHDSHQQNDRFLLPSKPSSTMALSGISKRFLVILKTIVGGSASYFECCSLGIVVVLRKKKNEGRISIDVIFVTPRKCESRVKRKYFFFTSYFERSSVSTANIMNLSGMHTPNAPFILFPSLLVQQIYS
jgi:hypothetical protein